MLPVKTPQILPDEATFSQRFASGYSQLVWTSVPADLDTPVSAMLRLMQNDAPCFLLESVEKGEIRGRYSVIGLMPDLIWRAHGNTSEICHNDRMDAAHCEPCEGDALDAFRKLYENSKIDIPPELPPMAAGLVGFMGYDMVKLMEKLPDTKPDPIGIPDACFLRPKIMVIFDAVTDKIFITTTLWADGKRTDAKSAYAAAKQRIQHVLDRLSAPLPTPGHQVHHSVKMDDFKSNTPRADYNAMIDSAKEHIKAGDIFQVVLSQRFSMSFGLPPFALYRSLFFIFARE